MRMEYPKIKMHNKLKQQEKEIEEEIIYLDVTNDEIIHIKIEEIKK